MKHPDELTLLRMADGELPAERRGSTRGHLVECARCQAWYEALKTETEHLRSSLREDDEPLPDALREKGSLAWVLVAAVVMGALGVSSLWNQFVSPMLGRMDQVGLGGESLFTTILFRGLLFRGWTDMASTLTEIALFVSVLVLASTVGIWAWRRLRYTAMALSLGFALSLVPSDSSGAVIELDRETYLLPRGEILDNDLIVAAEIVRIEGTIKGDLIVAARLVEVSGSVSGDILGFAESIEVLGEVGGNIRTASRSLAVDGVVERNITAAGETIRLRPGARVGGSFTAAGRETIVSGPIARDLITAGQTHELTSRIGGSVLVAGERLTIGPGASTGGTVKFYGSVEPDVSDDAELASPVVFERVEDDEEHSALSRATHFVYFWAAAFVLGVAFVLVAPRATEAITTVHVPSYAKSGLVGFVAMVGVVALSFALVVTLVGLPLALVTLFLGWVGFYAAQVYVGVYIGKEILGKPADRSQLVVRLAVGLLAIHIAKNVPFAGPIVTFLVGVWGFGAVILWLLEERSRPSSPAEMSSVG
jgi:cytoskeletal protein CcmA (bactofilin family)